MLGRHGGGTAARGHDPARRARDPSDRGARPRGRLRLSLSVREFGLLVALARSGGGIVRREDLYRRVWGGALRDGDRSIDVYIHKLRVKLEQALPDARFIHTHVGFGDRFSPEHSRAFYIRGGGR